MGIMDLAPDVDIAAELGKEEAAIAAAPAVEQEGTVVAEVQADGEASPLEAPEPSGEAATETSPAVQTRPAVKTVPLAALQEARNELKAIKEEQRRTREESSRQIADMQARIKAFEAPPPQKPDFTQDPANYLKGEVEQIAKTQAEIVQNNQRAQLQQAITQRLNTSEQAFMQRQADYGDAAKHLLTVVMQNLEQFGVAPEKRQEAAQNEINRITITAAQTGKEPAEMIYSLAKVYGYSEKKPVAAVGSKLETIAKGQEASQSLGSGGRAESGGLTLDAIARMDDDDFTALIADEKKWKQVGKLLH